MHERGFVNTMSYRGYSARVEFDDEDNIFVGRIAGIRDGIGFHSDSVAGLRTAFHEAVDDYRAACAKMGKSPQKPFSGNVMFRVDPAVHAKMTLAAELAGKSLNEWAEEALSRAAKAMDAHAGFGRTIVRRAHASGGGARVRENWKNKPKIKGKRGLAKKSRAGTKGSYGVLEPSA